jgi:glycosyltransferase involved in cell wall biosynthesis
MINGIPPIVSDRGSLPHVIGGDHTTGGCGFVLPLPAWLQPSVHKLPTSTEAKPWFDAVCTLWDNADLYAAHSARCRASAEQRFSENTSRHRHVEYFAALMPGQPLFAKTADGGRQRS